MIEEKPQIDQNALSRQLAVYGHEAQGKLMALKVFLYGVTGVIISSIFSWVSKSQRISSWPVLSKSAYTILTWLPSKTWAETSTPENNTLENWHVPRHHYPNWKNLTLVSKSISLLTPISQICTYPSYKSSSNYTCVVVNDHYDR